MEYKFLRFVEYIKLSFWDTKRYLHNISIGSNEGVLLSDILKPYKKSVSKEEIIKNRWQIISKINFGGELFLREFEEIETYKGNLFLVPENAIIYSKINVRHGCIYFNKMGNIPFCVSSEYPAFIIDEDKVKGKFLQRLLRTNEFKKLLNTKTTGISKARVKQDEFLNISIPLPSLDEQEAIVSAYQSKIEEAQQLETQAQQLENEIENYLFEELGVNFQKYENLQSDKLHFVDFKDMERWDILSINRNKINSKYSKLKFGDIVLGKPTYGANVKGVKKISDTRYIRITDINENGTLNDEFVSPEFAEEKYLLKENDFLIARSGNTVGKTFLYDNSYGKAIYAGYLVKYNLNLNIVSPQYILAYTKSLLFKQWITSNKRVSGQPNINGQEYLEAPFIIPPLSKQNEIAATIATMKQTQKQKTETATRLRAEALAEFEQVIFN
ncbi:restriction endonuclease subunit S [Bergeyella zoohelcum]|uniref:EcoKI restriction-modification system protein HsdS n=1 Tax=Bergeyella zoohelcum TaxID=1015 RepID=A0A380ZTI2_9FLAO|nr:restriction endonuclease subunit S [Bergeyella zoohelcum]EKB59971.1 hypothetical protein HMPREF9700_01477 [Bergeyella zoohelcum CCUG 30536]SUV52653.1 EcoKI restriction-modification system protein HsdS [Bergeyella zoohelcum]